MSLKMKILWDSCLFCHTPINLRYTHVHPIEARVFRQHINSTWADSNMMRTEFWYRKRLSGKWIKLCGECFWRKIKVTPHVLRQREIGALKFQTPQPSGWTDVEFRSWLEHLRVRYNHFVRHELQSTEVDTC